MFRYNYILFFGVLFVVSCRQEMQTEVIELPALRGSSVYNDDSVSVYLTAYQDKHKATAAHYIEKAEEAAESNPKKAVYYYKRAITLYPQYDTYKALGELLLKNEMYEEAELALGFIANKSYIKKANGDYEDKYLFQEPDEDLYYEFIVASINHNGYLDAYLVHLGQESKLDLADFKDRLTSDARIKFDKSSEAYKNLLLAFMTEDEIKEFRSSETVFADFIQSIRDTSSVFVIDEKKVQDFDYSSMWGEGEEYTYKMSDFYIWFLEEKIANPDQWYIYNYNHLINISDTVKAVIYAIDTSENACPKDMRHIYHRLVTYGKKGNMIASRIIAQQSGEVLNTVKINNNKFIVSEYKRIWRKPYVKSNFDNDVVKSELAGQIEGIIMPDGSIEVTGPASPQVIAVVADTTK